MSLSVREGRADGSVTNNWYRSALRISRTRKGRFIVRPTVRPPLYRASPEQEGNTGFSLSLSFFPLLGVPRLRPLLMCQLVAFAIGGNVTLELPGEGEGRDREGGLVRIMREPL